MFVRAAFQLDIPECLSIDGSYETDSVWQLDQRVDESGIAVNLRVVRLPRPVRVAYPQPGPELHVRWEQGACVLVGMQGGRVCGYLDMSAIPDQGLALVHHLVVDEPFRRRGLGRRLMQDAMRWARQRSLSRLIVALQSKNHPGVQFCSQLGLVFCGYNDRYFANRDIALLYAGRLHT